jgi:hypothetical protein
MARTQRRLDADQGYQDGHIFVPATSINVTTGASGVVNATSYNGITTAAVLTLSTAATAYVLSVPLSELIFRYGLQDDTQEAFGAGGLGGVPYGSNALAALNQTLTSTTTAGPSTSPVTLTVSPNTAILVVGAEVQIDSGANAEFQVITAIPSATTVTVGQLAKAHTQPYTFIQNPFTTPAGVTGAPPFTGFSQLTPVTAPRPKGITLKAMYPVYAVANGVAALTVNTIGIVGAKFANAAALPAADTILAAAANGLQTAANAANQQYVTPVAIPTAKQVFQTTRFEEFTITWALTTGAATGTVGVWGIFFDILYNLN